MSARIQYDSLLKTAEWRVFSWEQKEAAGFKCAFCKACGAERLETHHWWYVPGSYPWEVERGQVGVMCGECHAVLHREFETFKAWVLARLGNHAAREFLRTFRKLVFPGLSPESFTRMNARLNIGEESAGDVASAASKVMAGLTTKG